MTIGELIFLIFCSIAALNAFFLAVYLWIQREKNVIPSILICVFLIIVADRIIKLLLHDIKEDFNLNFDIPLAYYLLPTIALIGPFLYFYIRSVSQKTFKFRWIYILHIIPFIFIYFTLLILYTSKYSNTKQLLYYFLTTIILIQPLIYFIFAFNYSTILIKNSKECNFPKENINPYWIRSTVIATSFIYVLDVVYCFESYTKINIYASSMEPVFYSSFIFWMLFQELRYRRITTINNFITRIKTSGIPMQEILRYKSLLMDYVREKEVYKDRDITLGRLAKELSMTPHLLSQIINEQFSYNFNDFINSYRIEEAKKMLVDESMTNFTIASIAYDCGFNTLSAFNVAFKKFSGVTPSQFRLKEK